MAYMEFGAVFRQCLTSCSTNCNAVFQIKNCSIVNFWYSSLPQHLHTHNSYYYLQRTIPHFLIRYSHASSNKINKLTVIILSIAGILSCRLACRYDRMSHPPPLTHARTRDRRTGATAPCSGVHDTYGRAGARSLAKTDTVDRRRRIPVSC